MPMVGCSETGGDGGSGGSAGTGGMAGGGGTGGMPECQNPEDCDDNEDCTVDSCTEGMCEFSSVQSGSVCVPPFAMVNGVCVAGECRADTCDTADNCGDDLNDCTTTACTPVDGIGLCSTTPEADGTSCAGGMCQAGVCELASSVLPCNEQGIRNALYEGTGPYTFDCDRPTTVTTGATFGIERDVIIDGGGNLTLDLNGSEDDVIIVSDDVVAELYGVTVTGGTETGIRSAGGTLVLTNSTVSGNGGGIRNLGSMTLVGVTVSDNACSGDSQCVGGGIQNFSTMTLTNCTVSGNEDGAIANHPGGRLSVLNSTVSGAIAVRATTTLTNTLVEGTCEINPVVSNGYNIETPGNTCGFDHGTDLVNITEGQLDLGLLQDNGGDTMTHALGVNSVALDIIPALDCEVDEDQRGVMRPQGDACDVGAFELEVAP